MNNEKTQGQQTIKKGFFAHAKSDIPSGLVVFLIALPLCLGISMASGAPLFSGIIAGIVGGIVVGFLSDSQVNVSGPAASVALVVLTAISTLGSFEAVLAATVLAGIIQIILGFLRAGTIAYFFPSAMIKGILASIGLILILKQIPHALGYDGVFEGIESFMQPDGRNTFTEILYVLNDISLGAVIITLTSLAIILLWDRPAIKNVALFRFLPSALLAVLVSIGLNILFQNYFPGLALNENHLVQLPEASDIGEFFSFFSTPDFSQFTNPQIINVALSIAFIASLESLLSTEAGDKLDRYKRRTSTNRELKAQGIGNIVSGLIGGLPVTAVIVRTSANVSSGAVTKLSTIVHGTLMLVCVMLIPGILNLIPLASLSAVLFVVGYKLTSFPLYKSMYNAGKRQFVPFIMTVLAVMFTDLITGIIIGGIISVFVILRDSYKAPYFFNKEAQKEGEKIYLTLSEEVTFLNKASILLTLDHIPPNSEVVIDGSRSNNIDYDVQENFEEFKKTAAFKNIKVEFKGMDKFMHNGAFMKISPTSSKLGRIKTQ